MLVKYFVSDKVYHILYLVQVHAKKQLGQLISDIISEYGKFTAIGFEP